MRPGESAALRVQTGFREQSGQESEPRWLARAVQSSLDESIYSYVERFTISLRMKLCKQIGIVNNINDIVKECTNYRQKQRGRELGRVPRSSGS